MAVSVQQIRPIAHVPLVLGVVRRLEGATVIERLIAPHPRHVLSPGYGVEAMVLAILDGEHALYKVGQRLEERGMLDLLQPAFTRASLHDDRFGHILDTLFAANLQSLVKYPRLFDLFWPWSHPHSRRYALLLLAHGIAVDRRRLHLGMPHPFRHHIGIAQRFV